MKDECDKLSMNVQVNYEWIYNSYLLFGVVFLYNLIFIFQGLDVIDFGYHLSSQISAFTYPQITIPSEMMIFFTNYIGGFWLALIGEPSVLWARIGGVLLTALNAAIIYSILSCYFEKPKVLFIVLFSTIFLSSFDIMSLIHYYSFPAFLISIDLWLFNKIIQSPPNDKYRAFFEIMLGFMLIPIILSKITMILFVFFPGFVLGLIFISKWEWRYLFKYFFNLLIGFSISGAIFGLFYWKLGFLPSYLADIFVLIKGTSPTVYAGHSLTGYIIGMQSTYSTIFFNIVSLIILFLGLFVAFGIVKKIANDKNITIIILFTFLLILVYLSFQMMTHLYETYGIWGISIEIVNYIAGMLILLSIIYFIKNKNNNYKITCLIFLGLLEMIITPFGSATWNFWAFEGMWLILPLVLLCTLQSIGKMTSIFSKTLLNSIFSSLLIALLLFSIFFHSINMFYDDPNRLKLNTEFSDKSLAGIYSTPDRVKVIDSLLTQIKRYSNKNDEILLMNHIPIFYYLSERRPPLRISPFPDTLPIEYLEDNQKRLENENHLPKLFIYSKVDTARKIWEYPQTEQYQSVRMDKIDYIVNEYANRLNYTYLWENNGFVIYGNPQIFSHSKNLTK